MKIQFDFGTHSFQPEKSGALWWPRQSTLMVADLHLEKASYFATSGQMLPPYDSQETLLRLAHEIDRFKPIKVICLGDSFHDPGAFDRLHSETRLMLRRLTRSVEWVWITGNHDRLVAGDLGGRSGSELVIQDVCLRHEADPSDPRLEISGHFHPKVKIRQRGRTIARRCFARTSRKLVLPAFGTFTGGLDVGDIGFTSVVGTSCSAIVVGDFGVHEFPVSDELNS